MLLSRCEFTSLMLLVTRTKSQQDIPMIIKIVFTIKSPSLKMLG